MNKEIDVTNKVIIDIDKYIELREELKDAKNEIEKYKDKYENFLRYVLSESSVGTYTNGNKYLKFDYYNSHIMEYINEIEPKLYAERLEKENNEE